MLRLVSTLALMLVCFACGARSGANGRPASGAPPAPPGTAIEPEASPAPAGGRSLRVTPLPPDTPIWFYGAGFWVVRDEDEWRAGEELVDFDEDMVLIASAGMGSGEGMVVTNAVTLEGAVHVSVNHHLPGRNCPTLDAEEWMGQAVAIERAEGPVHVYVERHQNPPCLEEPVAALECWTATRPEQRAPSLRSIEPATIHCDASASRTDGGRGEPESWSWRMISAPEESALEPGPLGGEGPELQMEMDVAGTYAWEVTITDAQRNQAAAHGSAVKGRPEHAVAKITIAPDGGATHVLHDDRPRAAGSRMTVGTVRMPRGTFTPADRGSGTSSASASVSLAIGFGLE